MITVFALAGRLGGDNAWDPEGPRKALLTAGQLASELNESRRILQDISGQEVTGFCYPYGDLDERSVKGAQEAGYHYGCSVYRADFMDDHVFPRFNITDTGSPYHLWRRGLRYWLRWEYQGARQVPGASPPSRPRAIGWVG